MTVWFNMNSSSILLEYERSNFKYIKYLGQQQGVEYHHKKKITGRTSGLLFWDFDKPLCGNRVDRRIEQFKILQVYDMWLNYNN